MVSLHASPKLGCHTCISRCQGVWAVLLFHRTTQQRVIHPVALLRTLPQVQLAAKQREAELNAEKLALESQIHWLKEQAESVSSQGGGAATQAAVPVAAPGETQAPSAALQTQHPCTSGRACTLYQGLSIRPYGMVSPDPVRVASCRRKGCAAG